MLSDTGLAALAYAWAAPHPFVARLREFGLQAVYQKGMSSSGLSSLSLSAFFAVSSFFAFAASLVEL